MQLREFVTKGMGIQKADMYHTDCLVNTKAGRTGMKIRIGGEHFGCSYDRAKLGCHVRVRGFFHLFITLARWSSKTHIHIVFAKVFLFDILYMHTMM